MSGDRRRGRMNRVDLLPMSEVRRELVEYVIPGLVPRGMLTTLVGDPGLGKSMLTCAWAAFVSQEQAVIMLNAEDAYGAVIRPRLEAAGANLDRVFYVAMRGEEGDVLEEGLSFPTDVSELDRLVGEYEAALVVIDPITAHLSAAIDSHKDTSVRLALRPLYRIAERYACSMILCAHQNKGVSTDPLRRIGGSVAFPASVRSQLLLARDPEEPDGARRVLAHTKSNVGPIAESQVWRMEAFSLPAADGMPANDTARLVLDGASQFSGRDLLAAVGDDDRGALGDAVAFLAAELEDGPRLAKDVKRAARDAGVSDRTLDRAKGKLGVKVRREGGRFGAWHWQRPSKDANLSSSDDPEVDWRSLESRMVDTQMPSSAAKAANSETLALFDRGDDVKHPE